MAAITEKNPRGAGRPPGSLNGVQKADLIAKIATLEQQLRDLRAQQTIDTKKLDALLFALGEKSAALALDREAPDEA